MKYNTGARGVKVLAGIGNGRVLLWHYIDGRWNGGEAARCYEGPMANALKTAYPAKRSYNILEDNDPTGFKSSKGIMAKRKVPSRRLLEIIHRCPKSSLFGETPDPRHES